jgi:hypothetical protein
MIHQQILKIINQLKRIDGRTSPWNASYTFNWDLHDNVLPHDEFIENINSFPCVMFTVDNTVIRHIGGGERYVVISFLIRGITWSDDVEEGGDLLADDIEHALSRIKHSYPEFEEVRLDTVQTDEGLNRPFGATLIRGTLVYRHD